jgi:serine/alanine adding enzyme
MELIEVSKANGMEGEWDAFVEHHDATHFFHLFGYRDVVEKAFGHHSHYLAAREGGHIVGILPLFVVKSWLFGRTLVSLPYVDYGGICAETGEAARVLFDAAMDRAQGEHVQQIELRQQHTSGLDLPTWGEKVNSVLPLDGGAEVVWKRLRAKVRNQVRKAERAGIVFEVGGVERLDDFYRVFAQNMRDLGTPVYSRTFFAHLLTQFCESTELLLVVRRGEVVGGGVAIYFKDSMEVPWASSRREAFRYCPNNMLYWGAISRACEKGLLRFHFGRSTRGSSSYRFKAQWGVEDRSLPYHLCPVDGGRVEEADPRRLKYRVGVWMWKRMPVALATTVGPSIAKYIP